MTKEISEDIKTIVSDKYLSYAISTIISRSLPDVRDGLKPVHRRIIYSMYELNLKPKSPFKKSARIVGDVMGKYHPHGDSAIYDAMVRMAQSFSIRYPLVEGQGNFGNIDGDNPAAMRYTEARLDENANNLLNGLDQNAVNFIDNYDGQNKEPVVLPALVPNILLNGSTGIAVGMATNIPSHNLKEITEALIELIRNSKITNNKLIKIIKGPDFPTGGEILMNNQNLIDIYSKGKGSFTNRAKWRKVNLSKGLYNIEIYEIPYSINKNRIIENIANLIKDKKIPIDDVWDDSDENIRILIKPKNRNIQPNKLMDVLFKYTDLSVKFHCNFNVLIDGKIPKLLGLKDILLNFIQHRKDVVKRISIFKINKISIRIEILLGLLIAYKNIDKIIKIIRKSKDPKIELKKKFRLKENQVIAILDMKLRSLRKIEENELRKELKKLKNELIFLKKLIKSQSELNKYLIKEFEKYLIDTNELNLERKTNIFIDDNIEKQDTKIEEFEDIEDLTLVCSQKDNIKIYKGHVSFDNIGFKNEKLKYSLKIKSNDKIMFFTNDGKLYSLTPEIFPGGKSNGSNFSFFVNLNSISKIIGICAYKKDFKCLLASKKSKGFIYNPEESPKVQKNGKQIFNLKKEDKLIKMIYPLNKFVATVSSYQKLLIFNINEIPELKKSSGVLLQQIKDGDLCDVQLIDNNEGLQWNIGKQLRQEKNFDFWFGKRAQVGKKVPKRFNKELKFI